MTSNSPYNTARGAGAGGGGHWQRGAVQRGHSLSTAGISWVELQRGDVPMLAGSSKEPLKIKQFPFRVPLPNTGET